MASERPCDHCLERLDLADRHLDSQRPAKVRGTCAGSPLLEPGRTSSTTIKVLRMSIRNADHTTELNRVISITLGRECFDEYDP